MKTRMFTVSVFLALAFLFVLPGSERAKATTSSTNLIWETRASMPTTRYAMGVAVSSNGKIYAIGGDNYTNTPLSAVEQYDPVANTWTTRASMPTRRWRLGVAATSNGKLYAIGGENCGIGSCFNSNLITLNTVEEYDSITNTWVTRASMPTPRHSLGVVVASNGKIYAIGGSNSNGDLATVEEYDPDTNTWTARANMPTARNSLGVVATSNGKIYAISGSTVEEYNLVTNTWVKRANMPTGRWALGVVTGSDGTIYAVGGNTGLSGYVNTVEQYDLTTDTWTSKTSMPTARSSLGLVITGDGNIYAIGGWGLGGYPGYGGNGALGTVEVATPTNVSVSVTSSGHFISSHIQDNASLPLHVQVTNLTTGLPVSGASIRILNGNVFLGTTNSNGSLDASLQMPSIPSIEDFITEVIAQVNGSNFSSGLVTLYHADLLAGEPMTITQDEANNYTNALLYHYATRPGISCPVALCRVLKLLDLLAKIVLQQQTYTPQVDDIATVQVYRYSAQGVTPVYLYFESTKRGSNTIYTYTKWTEDITQVQPFINSLGVARNTIVMKLASPATALVTDPTGKPAGFDPNTGLFVFDIPVAISDSGEEPYFLLIPSPAIGQYTFQLTGTANGTYTMDIKTQNAQGQASTVFQTTTQITQGSTHTYSITYNPLSLYLPLILDSQ